MYCKHENCKYNQQKCILAKDTGRKIYFTEDDFFDYISSDFGDFTYTDDCKYFKKESEE